MSDQEAGEHHETFRCIVLGASGTGKTHFVREQIKKMFQAKVIQKAYLFCDTRGNDPLFSKHFTSYQIEQNVNQIMMHQSKFKKAPPIVIVFDDVLDQKLVLSDTFNRLFATGRHKNINIMFISQSSTRVVSQLMFNNVTHMVIFRMNNLTQLKDVARDHMRLNADDPSKSQKQVVQEKLSEIQKKTSERFGYYLEDFTKPPDE